MALLTVASAINASSARCEFPDFRIIAVNEVVEGRTM